MATRKISDLTLLGVGQVSSSDTLLLLDNSDPTDQNKISAVGSIFTAVPHRDSPMMSKKPLETLNKTMPSDADLSELE